MVNRLCFTLLRQLRLYKFMGLCNTPLALCYSLYMIYRYIIYPLFFGSTSESNFWFIKYDLYVNFRTRSLKCNWLQQFRKKTEMKIRTKKRKEMSLKKMTFLDMVSLSECNIESSLLSMHLLLCSLGSLLKRCLGSSETLLSKKLFFSP